MNQKYIFAHSDSAEFWIAGLGMGLYRMAMTKTTAELLEKVRKLPVAERQELCETILREAAAAPRQTAQPKKRIADIAGKYSPEPCEDAAEHDRGFVEAVIASKARSRAA